MHTLALSSLGYTWIILVILGNVVHIVTYIQPLSELPSTFRGQGCVCVVVLVVGDDLFFLTYMQKVQDCFPGKGSQRLGP